MLLAVDPGDVGVAAMAGGDHGCFGDEEGAWDGGTLTVVVFDEGEEGRMGI